VEGRGDADDDNYQVVMVIMEQRLPFYTFFHKNFDDIQTLLVSNVRSINTCRYDGAKRLGGQTTRGETSINRRISL